VRGAYSMLILANDKMIAVKDPNGFRPLALGRVGDSYVFASETCAFDLIEAEYLRPLEPGELVSVHKGAMTSMKFAESKKISKCIFELIYFARPDSYVFGDVVYERRKAMGVQLAREAPVDADLVMPFPDSGNYAAVGYSQESGLPLELAMIRNHYVGRTFIQPSQDMRDFSVRVKLNPVKSMIKGKRIVIVEDSIVRGTTIRARVQKLRELGVREIHLRVSCPPIKFPCFYGIDFSSKGELIAANHSVEDIARFMNIDSLHYLTIPGLVDSVTQNNWCLACFDGNYPVPLADRMGKDCLEAVPGIIKEFC
jgi:amidophosphoribosyltransferase